jgi:hypothetical protein
VKGELLRWVGSIGLEEELARLLRKGDVFDGLKGLKGMPDAELEAHVREVCAALAARLPALLRGALARLRARAAGTSEARQHVNSKFCMDGAFVGQFATLSDFFRGPEALIGVPNPKVEEGALQEHCSRSNALEPFHASNYDLVTRPKWEWLFVVDPAAGKREFEAGFRYPHTPMNKSEWPDGTTWKGDCGRKEVKIEDFLAVAEVKERVTEAGLVKTEAIGLRLYSGPMFVLYNAVLRGFPAKDVACLKGNRYETTIFMIVSGITKLSKISAVPKNRLVYRGLGGMLLPDQFWEEFAECQVPAGRREEGPAADCNPTRSRPTARLGP